MCRAAGALSLAARLPPGAGLAERRASLLNRKPVARRAEGPCSREGRSRFGLFARMREKPAPEGRIGRGKQRRRSPSCERLFINGLQASRCRAKSLCIRGNAGGGEDAGAGRALSRLLRPGLSGLAALSGRWVGARRCTFCRRVWASVYAGACGSVGVFALGSRLLFVRPCRYCVFV